MNTEELQKIKDSTNAIMLAVKGVNNVFNKAYGMALYEQVKKGEVITWESLNHISVGDSINLPTISGGKIIFTRKENETDDIIVFTLLYDPVTHLSKHAHNCVEILEVVSGEFDTIISNAKLHHRKVSRGDIISIPANVYHNFVNNSNEQSILKVKYIRP